MRHSLIKHPSVLQSSRSDTTIQGISSISTFQPMGRYASSLHLVFLVTYPPGLMFLITMCSINPHLYCHVGHHVIALYSLILSPGSVRRDNPTSCFLLSSTPKCNFTLCLWMARRSSLQTRNAERARIYHDFLPLTLRPCRMISYIEPCIVAFATTSSILSVWLVISFESSCLRRSKLVTDISIPFEGLSIGGHTLRKSWSPPVGL